MIMNNDIEVLIIDDHDVLESYQQLLEMSGFKVKAITDQHWRHPCCIRTGRELSLPICTCRDLAAWTCWST